MLDENVYWVQVDRGTRARCVRDALSLHVVLIALISDVLKFVLVLELLLSFLPFDGGIFDPEGGRSVDARRWVRMLFGMTMAIF